MTLLLPEPARESRIQLALGVLQSRASRHYRGGTRQSVWLRILALVGSSRRRSRRRARPWSRQQPLPSYLPRRPAPPESNTRGYSPSSISWDADRIYRRRHPLPEERLQAEPQHPSKSQSMPNQAWKEAESPHAAAGSALQS